MHLPLKRWKFGRYDSRKKTLSLTTLFVILIITATSITMITIITHNNVQHNNSGLKCHTQHNNTEHYNNQPKTLNITIFRMVCLILKHSIWANILMMLRIIAHSDVQHNNTQHSVLNNHILHSNHQHNDAQHN